MLARVRQHSAWGLLWLALMLAGSAAGSTTAFALRVDQIESSKGIKAWLVEEHSVPLVALRFALDGGSVQDQAGKEGLTSLMADLLTEGAGNLSNAQFKEKLSTLGSQLSAWAGRDAVYGELQTLSARLQPSAELLRLMVTAPTFAPDDFERGKAQRLSDLALASKKPEKIALQRWYADAFPGHAYGRPVDGTAETIGRVAREDVKAQYGRLFARDVLKVVIVGDIDKRGAMDLLDTVFGGMAGKAQLTSIAKAVPRSQSLEVVKREYPLSTALFGLPSLPIDHADYPALKVLNHIIGSGDFDCRLMEEIRVKRGLAYSVQTNLEHDSIASFMLGSLATKNESMKPALDVLKSVLEAVAREGPTSTQFENAKQYLTGSFLLDYDTNAKVAGSLLAIWLDGEGPDALVNRGLKIKTVTLQDVKRVAVQVLKVEQLSVTVVGNPAGL